MNVTIWKWRRLIHFFGEKSNLFKLDTKFLLGNTDSKEQLFENKILKFKFKILIQSNVFDSFVSLRIEGEMHSKDYISRYFFFLYILWVCGEKNIYNQPQRIYKLLNREGFILHLKFLYNINFSLNVSYRTPTGRSQSQKIITNQ